MLSQTEESTQQQHQQQQQHEQNKIPFNDRMTTILDHPVKVKLTVANLANDILNHNKHNQYSQILFIGSSGSGKTTCRQNLIHALHTRHNYAIHYYSKKEIHNLSRILKNLQKGVDCILAFDDVSYTFQEMKPSEIAEILHQLTFVRHTVKARVIVMLSIHYSYGILKGLRQAAFRIITSATDEERENYAKTFGGHNRQNIRHFTFQYRTMMLYNFFTVPLPNGEMYRYTTDKPFRLALVSNLGILHYILYHKIDCGICNEREKKEYEITEYDISFWSNMAKTYPLKNLIKILNFYIFIKTGRPVLGIKDRRIWKQISTYSEAHSLDLEKIALVLKEAKKIPLGEQKGYVIDRLGEIAKIDKERLASAKIDVDEKLFDKDPQDPSIGVSVEEDEDEEQEEEEEEEEEIDIPEIPSIPQISDIPDMELREDWY